jgi:hypothetical protein
MIFRLLTAEEAARVGVETGLVPAKLTPAQRRRFEDGYECLRGSTIEAFKPPAGAVALMLIRWPKERKSFKDRTFRKYKQKFEPADDDEISVDLDAAPTGGSDWCLVKT